MPTGGAFAICAKVDIELGDAVFIVAAVFQVNGRLGANVGSLKSLKCWIVKTVRMANALGWQPFNDVNELKYASSFVEIENSSRASDRRESRLRRQPDHRRGSDGKGRAAAVRTNSMRQSRQRRTLRDLRHQGRTRLGRHRTQRRRGAPGQNRRPADHYGVHGSGRRESDALETAR